MNYIIKKKKKHIFLKIILSLLIIFIVTLICIAIIGYAFFKKTYNDVTDDYNSLLEKMKVNSSESVILNLKGEVIATLKGNEKRKVITVEEMSKYLPLAYIAIEDERFYEHKGIDIKRTGGAIYTYLKNDKTSSFGGSTITQQLVKNVTGENGVNVERKIREWVLAYRLEKEFSKNEILEKYLNIIFTGADVYGVEMGSQHYFNKSAIDLSIAESAFLAGITHEPNSYDPFSQIDNSERILNRTKIVLNKMLEVNCLSYEEYQTAILELEQGLKFEEGNTSNRDIFLSYRCYYQSSNR